MTLLFRISAVLVLLAVLYFTLGPVDVRAVSPLPPQPERAAAFALLAVLWVLAYPRHFVATAVVILVLAIGLEFAQELRPGRHGREADAMIKLAGAAVGLGIGALLRRPAKDSSGQ